MADAAGGGSPFDVPAAAAPAPEPEQPGDFVFIGVKPRALMRLLDIYPEIVGKKLTTSDVCHTILKPMTVPAGWVDQATCTNAEESWYGAHRYRWRPIVPFSFLVNIGRIIPAIVTAVLLMIKMQKLTKVKAISFGAILYCVLRWIFTPARFSKYLGYSKPPPRTCSYADLLKKDPELSDLVGFPTVFWSHPWKDQFADVVTTMNEQYPEEFVWFDCAVLDEHASQNFSQDWWGTVFKDAIKTIGHTVMRLSPWDDPHTLKRAWCLWEVYCSVVGGAKFSVSLDKTQRANFIQAILRDFAVVQEKFASIDVKTAKAGNPDDERMIKASVQAMPGGFGHCNMVVFDQIRRWIRSVLDDLAVESIGMDLRSGNFTRSKSDDEVTEEDLDTAGQVAILLMESGQTAEAKAMYEEVIAGFTAKLGADSLI